MNGTSPTFLALNFAGAWTSSGNHREHLALPTADATRIAGFLDAPAFTRRWPRIGGACRDERASRMRERASG